MDSQIDIKDIIEREKILLKERVCKLTKKGIIPKLAIILIGNNQASKLYVNKKERLCKEIGIDCENIKLDDDIQQTEILNIIDRLNKHKDVHGILLQLPIPKHFDVNIIINSINYKKDVDGFHPLNLGNLMAGNEQIVPCTPLGILTILDNLKIDIKGKNCVIVGRSLIVGKPMASLMTSRNATVTICHSKTIELEKYTKQADILIVAVGKVDMIKDNMVKEGSVVIDVGINSVGGKIRGDVDFENVVKKVKYITKVPGSVGPMTVLMLAKNLISLAELIK